MTLKRKVSRPHWGHVIGLLFLFIQLMSIGYARIIPERFFCWAPYDQHSRYRISVVLGDEELTNKQIKRRYRYRSAEAWESRSIHNLFSIIRQYESTYGKDDGALVKVTYSTNGHPREQWHWPEK
jgi:hypothetical protein